MGLEVGRCGILGDVDRGGLRNLSSSGGGGGTLGSGGGIIVVIVGTWGSAEVPAGRVTIASVARFAAEVKVRAFNVTRVGALSAAARTANLADGAATLLAAHDDTVVRRGTASVEAAAPLATFAASSAGAAQSTEGAAVSQTGAKTISAVLAVDSSL